MKRTTIFIAVLVLGLMHSCKEDVDIFEPDPLIVEPIELVGDIDNFFEAIRTDKTQTYPVIAEWGKSIITPTETVVEIAPNIFQDQNENIVTGPIEVKILELYGKGEMLIYGKPTISDGKLLESAGEFFIEVFQDGKPLSLIPGKQINIKVPNDSPREQMELFWGENVVFESSPNPSGAIDLVFNWSQADEDPDAWNSVFISEWVVQEDSTSIFGFGYECFSDSLQWINFDIFNDYPEEELTNVCVDLPEIYGNVNTVVYLVFEDLNSFIALPGNGDLMQFCNFYTKFIQIGVPIGANVTFVAISEQGEDCYHFATSSTQLVVDHLETLTPEKTDLETIKAFLMGL